MKEASEAAKGSVDITPQIAGKLIEELRIRKIDFIVAPYEADAQLTYLQKIDYIHFIITEDSDLLAFGCDNVIYKLDHNGDGFVINSSEISNMKEFRSYSHKKFLHLCILSGCDYLPSLEGIGLKKALKGLQKYDSGVKLIQSWIKFGKWMDAPYVRKDYLQDFEKAELTFKHQRVYNPVEKTLTFLNDPKISVTEYDIQNENFIGELISNNIAMEIASGVLDPITKLPLCQQVGTILDITEEIVLKTSKKYKGSVEKTESIFSNSSQNSISKQMHSQASVSSTDTCLEKFENISEVAFKSIQKQNVEVSRQVNTQKKTQPLINNNVVNEMFKNDRGKENYPPSFDKKPKKLPKTKKENKSNLSQLNSSGNPLYSSKEISFCKNLKDLKRKAENCLSEVEKKEKKLTIQSLAVKNEDDVTIKSSNNKNKLVTTIKNENLQDTIVYNFEKENDKENIVLDSNNDVDKGNINNSKYNNTIQNQKEVFLGLNQKFGNYKGLKNMESASSAFTTDLFKHPKVMFNSNRQ
ncbi:Rad2 nuclease [Clydaea vesicula]|uniref:Exonuclease 1 n=1 Tax=Clydaea vesicula TaxID=447962 RepID=A0AAD5UBJ5_9FUNG|nr:Rad2 nuclease [Clydaea vesicula]